MSGDALVATLDLPRANGELVFDEPWQARALGMGVVTIEALGIGAMEWRDALADAITPRRTEPTSTEWPKLRSPFQLGGM